MVRKLRRLEILAHRCRRTRDAVSAAAARLAAHNPRRHIVDLRHGLVLHQPDEHVHRTASHPGHIDSHRGEGRDLRLCVACVVKPRDRDLVRHLDPAVRESVAHSHRHVVVRADDHVGVVGADVQKLRHRGVAHVSPEITVKYVILVEGYLVFFHHPAEAVQTLDRIRVILRAADVAEIAVPVFLHQMVDDALHRVVVVHKHTVVSVILPAHAHNGAGRPRPDTLQQAVDHGVIGKCVQAQKQSVQIAEIRQIREHALAAHEQLVLAVPAENRID